MAFDTEEDTGVRGMTVLGEDGDLEITWEPENDEKVREIIEKKMKAGVSFFILKPVVGDMLHIRRKLTKMSDLKAHNIKIKDADIETLFAAGDVSMFRSTHSSTMQTAGKAKTSQQAVRNRTVGVPKLAGG